MKQFSCVHVSVTESQVTQNAFSEFSKHLANRSQITDFSSYVNQTSSQHRDCRCRSRLSALL